ELFMAPRHPVDVGVQIARAERSVVGVLRPMVRRDAATRPDTHRRRPAAIGRRLVALVRRGAVGVPAVVRAPGAAALRQTGFVRPDTTAGSNALGLPATTPAQAAFGRWEGHARLPSSATLRCMSRIAVCSSSSVV